jgi:metal-sulfur cluster biosynthetic enzyme
MSTDTKASSENVFEALHDVVDPELGIYGVEVKDDGSAIIDMTLTSAACPLTDVIEDQTKAALNGIVTEFKINWVWMPPWGPDKITDEGRQMLRALGFNL